MKWVYGCYYRYGSIADHEELLTGKDMKCKIFLLLECFLALYFPNQIIISTSGCLQHC